MPYALVNIASFDTVNGAVPSGSLLADEAGDLFGTTEQGGASGVGTVFEVVKTGTGYMAPIVLASSGGPDGTGPSQQRLQFPCLNPSLSARPLCSPQRQSRRKI